jgi:hypothetical protein
VQGIVNVTYSTVIDPPVGNLTVRVKEGSSQWWLALLVDNTGNAARSVQVRSGGGSWTSLQRADFNYWIADGGAGVGPFDVRVTDVAGHRATVTGITLSPGTVQATGVGLDSGKAVATTTRRRAGTTSRRPATSTSGVTSPATPSTTTTAPTLPTTSGRDAAAPSVRVADAGC